MSDGVDFVLQNFALGMPDALTVQHAWKDEKKPREYSFDSVFGPETSQDEVSVILAAPDEAVHEHIDLKSCTTSVYGTDVVSKDEDRSSMNVTSTTSDV